MPGGEGVAMTLPARRGDTSADDAAAHAAVARTILSTRQADLIRQVLAVAREETGLWFSLFIGPLSGDVRKEARRLHAALGEQAHEAVLIVVEPVERQVEVVTGRTAAQRLDDHAAGLAALSMATAFSGGDLVGGIVTGIRMLAEAAARPPIVRG